MAEASKAPARLPRTGLRAPDGKDFTWGPIQHIHIVGDYAIVEYLEDVSNFRQPDVWARHGRTLFHPWIGGTDTHHSYESLDSALIGAIAFRHEGPNGQAALYFSRMLGVTA